MDEKRDYLELARQNWDRGDDTNSALFSIAAALISIAESHQRVADALEKITQEEKPDVLNPYGLKFEKIE